MMESARFQRQKKICSAFGWALIALAVASALGFLVGVALIGLVRDLEVTGACIAGGCAAGLLLFGFLGYFVMKRAEKFSRLELDALEREDGEESFFVGEGVLCTFGESGAVLHGEDAKRVEVPYSEIRFLSVCERREPRDRGEWSVLLEIPSRYLSKHKRRGDPPVLVMAEGKRRLYEALARHSLVLLGEQPHEGEDKLYEKRAEFVLPDRVKRRRTIVGMSAGGLLAAGGVGAAFWQPAFGAALSVVGLYLLFRSLIAFGNAKETVGFYLEGLYYRSPLRAECIFLRWEDISRVTFSDGRMRAECVYGGYDFPCPAGAEEYFGEHHPEKCGE